MNVYMYFLKCKVDPWVQKEGPACQSNHNADIMREVVYQVIAERTRALESNRPAFESRLGETYLFA